MFQIWLFFQTSWCALMIWKYSLSSLSLIWLLNCLSVAYWHHAVYMQLTGLNIILYFFKCISINYQLSIKLVNKTNHTIWTITIHFRFNKLFLGDEFIYFGDEIANLMIYDSIWRNIHKIINYNSLKNYYKQLELVQKIFNYLP